MGVRIVKDQGPTAVDSKPIAEAVGVGKLFKDEDARERRVLQDISLSVSRGEVVCILGPSGCGKSTFLRILIGLVGASEGQVLCHGQPLSGIHPGASLVFQSFALYPWLTVEENVRMGIYRKGFSAAETRGRVIESIEKVGLSGFGNAYPKELSGGMKQRVGIARALVGQPEMLCLDEPFSALDVMTAEALRSEVYRLWSEGKAGLQSVLLITHIIEEAVYLGDRIVIFDSNPGRIRAIVPNPLKHPREYRSKGFQDLVDHVHSVLTAVHLPDVPAETPVPHAVPSPSRVLPLPHVTIGEITGMLEILHDHGDDMNLFDFQEFAGTELGVTLLTVKAAEMLRLVETPGDRMTLTNEGKRYVVADVNLRREVVAIRLRELGIFRLVLDRLAQAGEDGVAGTEIEHALAEQAPRVPVKDLADTVLNWGRVGGLFDYDMNRDIWLPSVPNEKA